MQIMPRDPLSILNVLIGSHGVSRTKTQKVLMYFNCPGPQWLFVPIKPTVLGELPQSTIDINYIAL